MEKMFRLMRGCKKNAHLRKIWMTMKLTIFLFFLAISQMMAVETYSQSTILSLNLKSVAVKDVLDEIERKSEFVFLYNSKLVDADRTVSMEFKDQKISEILDKLFQNTDVVYTVVDRQIVLTNKADQAGFVELSAVQQTKVSGKITDSAGASLPGVSVIVKGTTTGVISDNNGNYSLSNISENAVLQFSFVGMKMQEIVVGSKTIINVTLEDEITGIEEVVAVGYGKQKRESITGAVSDVKGELISKTPMASTTNSLAGQLPGLISVQTSGQPGSDAALLSIRGFGNALTIVDGVEADFNSIDANQIESVSILKDGAASIYGSRAGNGVILITTKRGNLGKPIITLNSSYTMQGITMMPQPASSGQYAEMQSEAWLQSGQDPKNVPYTTDQINKYYSGNDPQYPNTNWFNELVRTWAPQQQHNLSLRGGSDNIKYYGFFGYLDQETMWKTNGGGYGRYNFQSNIDAKILDNLSLQLDLATTYQNSKYTPRPQNAGDNTVWQDLWQLLPTYPAQLPDPTKIPYAVGIANATTNRDLYGYNDTNSQNLKGTASLNYTFKVIKGLSAKAFINYSQDNSYNKTFQKPLKFYTYDVASQTYTLANSLDSKAKLNQLDSKGKVITGQLSVTYDKIFSNDHHLTAMGLYEAVDYSNDWLSAARVNFLTPLIDQMYAGSTTGMSNSGAATEMGRASYVGRVNYSYKNKYLVETSLRRDASAKFPEDTRWGLFPSVSLGWRITEEGFMKSLPVFDNLKLRGSYGKSGLDNVSNFAFLSGYVAGQTYIFGSNAQQGYVSTGIANPNLTWEEIAITNLGLDFSLWKKKLYGEAEVFHRNLSGIPATRSTSLPTSFGATLPPENLNSLNDKGFEVKIGTSGSSKEFNWDISGNIAYSRSKWDHYDEPVYTDPDQIRISQKSGQWTDRAFGYKSAGLFTSQDQIDALKFNQDGQGNKSLKPGDIQYVDVNGDKVLDWKDQVEIGNGTVPHWTIGLNSSFKYKGFDLAALFQGAFGYSTNVQLIHQKLTPAVVYDLRWTETKNDANALVPRLGGAATNNYFSDFYYKQTGYLRLKTLSFGYTMPKNWIRKTQLEQVRLFMAGTNLITFNNLKKYGVDPESPSGMAGYYYPQQKTITFGVNISL